MLPYLVWEYWEYGTSVVSPHLLSWQGKLARKFFKNSPFVFFSFCKKGIYMHLNNIRVSKLTESIFRWTIPSINSYATNISGFPHACNSGGTFIEAPLIWIVLVVLDCVPSVPPVKSTPPVRAPCCACWSWITSIEPVWVCVSLTCLSSTCQSWASEGS